MLHVNWPFCSFCVNIAPVNELWDSESWKFLSCKNVREFRFWLQNMIFVASVTILLKPWSTVYICFMHSKLSNTNRKYSNGEGGGCANPGSAFGLGFSSTTSLLLALNLLQGYFLSSIGCVLDLKLKVPDSISFLIHHMNMYNQGSIYLLISIKGPGTINNLNFFAPTLFARNAIRPGSVHRPVLFVQGPFAFIWCMNNIL